MSNSVHEQLSKQLHEKEEIVRLVRRAGVTLVPSIGGGILLVLLDFFLIAWWFQFRPWGPVGFTAMLLVALAIGGRGWYIWSMNVIAITNQRVIDMNQHGLFRRTVAETTYDKIQDVRYTIQGVWPTMFKFGSIIIQTAGSSTTLELNNISRPFEVQQQIVTIQRELGVAASAEVSAAELLGLVERLKTKLGAETFQRLVDNPKPPPRNGRGTTGGDDGA